MMLYCPGSTLVMSFRNKIELDSKNIFADSFGHFDLHASSLRPFAATG